MSEQFWEVLLFDREQQLLAILREIRFRYLSSRRICQMITETSDAIQRFNSDLQKETRKAK